MVKGAMKTMGEMIMEKQKTIDELTVSNLLDLLARPSVFSLEDCCASWSQSSHTLGLLFMCGNDTFV